MATAPRVTMTFTIICNKTYMGTTMTDIMVGTTMTVCMCACVPVRYVYHYPCIYLLSKKCACTSPEEYLLRSVSFGNWSRFLADEAGYCDRLVAPIDRENRKSSR